MNWLLLLSFVSGFIFCGVLCFGKFIQLYDLIDYWKSEEIRAKWIAAEAMKKLSRMQHRIDGEGWRDGA